MSLIILIKSHSLYHPTLYRIIPFLFPLNTLVLLKYINVNFFSLFQNYPISRHACSNKMKNFSGVEAHPILVFITSKMSSRARLKALMMTVGCICSPRKGLATFNISPAIKKRNVSNKEANLVIISFTRPI